MKKYIYSLLIAAIVILIASSNLFGGKSSKSAPAKVTQTIEIPDSIKQKIEKQDSMINVLMAKVEKLSQNLEDSQKEITAIKEKKSEHSIVWKYLPLSAFVLAILALIAPFFRRVPSVAEVEETCKNIIGDKIIAQNRAISNISSKGNNQGAQPSNGQIYDLQSRIEKLERIISNLTKNGSLTYATRNDLNREKGNNRNPGGNQKDAFIQNGYAKLNTSKFFMDILPSNQETCVFSIKFINANKGEFNLISLDKIKSRNGWEEVIEYSGNCTMADATSFKVGEMGICEKVNDNTWEVVRKLKIIINK